MQANMGIDKICETLHMVLRTVLHYALSNEERIRKINVPQMLEHVKAIKDLPPGFYLTDPDDDDEGVISEKGSGKNRGPIKQKAGPAPRGAATTKTARKAPTRKAKEKEKDRPRSLAGSGGGSSPTPSKPSGRELRAERRRIEAAVKQASRVLPFTSRDIGRGRTR